MIVFSAPPRFARQARPGLAVIVIEIPLAADRFGRPSHQHAMTKSHLAVEMFHQPLLAPRNNCAASSRRVVEMFAIDHAAGDGELLT